MSDQFGTRATRTRYGPARSSLIALASLLRALPLFFRASPRTPLRVLAIVALDTVHVFRTSRHLTRKKTRELGVLLDFLACTNAALDHKSFREAEYRRLGAILKQAGLRVLAEDYLSRIRELESRRPQPGGDRRRFDEVRQYREAVVRLSLGTIAAVAFDAASLDDAIESTETGSDLAALTQLALLCQIIDDVMDYTEDLSAGLPSFLTATASLPEAVQFTASTTQAYSMEPLSDLEPRSAMEPRVFRPGVATRRDESSRPEFPLRLALRLFRIAAAVAIRVASMRARRAWAVFRSEPGRPSSVVPTAKP